MRKLVLLLLLILSISSFAQELNELSIIGKAEKTNDIVPSSIKDANNRKAACIVFLTDLEVDMDFRPNIELVKLISKAGRHEVYVQPGERVIEVFASGFKPLNVVLSSYGISKLESDDVYQLEITGEKKTILASGKGDLILKTVPAGAEISIEEFPDFKANTPYEFNNYLARPYKIHVTKYRYEPVDTVITIEKDKKHSNTIELKQKWGDLEITSEPSGADVYINNKLYGKTPLNLKGVEEGLDGGIYKLRIYKIKYAEKELDITIEKGKTLLIKKVKLTAKTGSISISVNPPDALIELRGDAGEYYNSKQINDYTDILFGTYNLKVSKDDYKSYREIINLIEGERIQKHITLLEGLDVPKGFVYVEAGSFLMGDTSDPRHSNRYHKKTVKSFYISKYEVTQKEWEEIMRDDRFKKKEAIKGHSSSYEGSNLPTKVNWYEAVELCNKKSIKDGLTPCYIIDKENKDPENTNKYDSHDFASVDDPYKWTVTCNFEVDGYRLPTEIEWEYAARGGIKSKGYKYSGSNDIREVGWYKVNSKWRTGASYPQPIGKKQPNELGIYDMSGNVREWCWEWYNLAINKYGNRSERVVRGGFYMVSDKELFVWRRDGECPSENFCTGIRLVRSKN